MVGGEQLQSPPQGMVGPLDGGLALNQGREDGGRQGGEGGRRDGAAPKGGSGRDTLCPPLLNGKAGTCSHTTARQLGN